MSVPGHFMGVPGLSTFELKWPDTRASTFRVSGHFVGGLKDRIEECS